MSDWGRPLWIAHRGGGRAAPENTLAAIRAGAAAGFRMVEFDVMLSRDGVPVLIHDDTLERTTTGRGAVAEHDFAALRELDAGAWHGPAFAGEVIPTLEEAIALLIELGLDANIEIKPAPGHARTTGDTVARTVAACWPAGRALPLFSSFDFDALEAARARAPEVPRGLLFEAVPDDWRTQMRALGAVSLHCDHGRLAAERLTDIVGAGIPLLCYTVNQADRAAALIAAGVCGLFTDCLDLPGQVTGR